MAVLGYGSSAVTFAWALIAANGIAAREMRPFPEYFVLLFLATLPVAYTQGIFFGNSLMPIVWNWAFPNPTNDSVALTERDSVAYLIAFTVIAAGSYWLARWDRGLETGG